MGSSGLVIARRIHGQVEHPSAVAESHTFPCHRFRHRSRNHPTCSFPLSPFISRVTPDTHNVSTGCYMVPSPMNKPISALPTDSSSATPPSVTAFTTLRFCSIKL